MLVYAVLKSESNLMVYDAKKFLLKHKIPEYFDDSNKYAKTFIKMHKLNMSESK